MGMCSELDNGEQKTKRHFCAVLYSLCDCIVCSVCRRVKTDRQFTLDWQDAGNLRQKQTKRNYQKQTPTATNTASGNNKQNSGTTGSVTTPASQLSSEVPGSRQTRNQVYLSSGPSRSSKSSHEHPAPFSDSTGRAGLGTRSQAGLSDSGRNAKKPDGASVSTSSSRKDAPSGKKSSSNSSSGQSLNTVSTSTSTGRLKNGAKSQVGILGTDADSSKPESISSTAAGRKDSNKSLSSNLKSDSVGPAQQNSAANLSSLMNSGIAKNTVRSHHGMSTVDRNLRQPSKALVTSTAEASHILGRVEAEGSGTKSSSSSERATRNSANKNTVYSGAAMQKARGVRPGGTVVSGHSNATAGHISVVNSSSSSVAIPISQQSAVPPPSEAVACEEASGRSVISAPDTGRCQTKIASNSRPTSSVTQSRHTDTATDAVTLATATASGDQATADNVNIMYSGKKTLASGLNAAFTRAQSVTGPTVMSSIAETVSVATSAGQQHRVR